MALEAVYNTSDWSTTESLFVWYRSGSVGIWDWSTRAIFLVGGGSYAWGMIGGEENVSLCFVEAGGPWELKAIASKGP